jgi:hypothetical protein
MANPTQKIYSIQYISNVSITNSDKELELIGSVSKRNNNKSSKITGTLLKLTSFLFSYYK